MFISRMKLRRSRKHNKQFQKGLLFLFWAVGTQIYTITLVRRVFTLVRHVFTLVHYTFTPVQYSFTLVQPNFHFKSQLLLSDSIETNYLIL